MVSKESRQLVRAKKHMKIRNRFSGTAERPRLAVFRSNNHMYAQIIDDTVGNTLVSASTLEKEIKAELEKTNNVDAAAYLGTVIAKRAIEKGIKEVVFDRGDEFSDSGYGGRYHEACDDPCLGRAASQEIEFQAQSADSRRAADRDRSCGSYGGGRAFKG